MSGRPKFCELAQAGEAAGERQVHCSEWSFELSRVGFLTVAARLIYCFGCVATLGAEHADGFFVHTVFSVSKADGYAGVLQVV